MVLLGQTKNILMGLIRCDCPVVYRCDYLNHLCCLHPAVIGRPHVFFCQACGATVNLPLCRSRRNAPATLPLTCAH